VRELMPKAAPTLAKLLTMVFFALSCFGLLIFLWLSFGGPIPLKPKGYRVQVAFPEATTLAEQADVRIAGVSVGKVVHKELDRGGNRTVAYIQLDRKYAPLTADSRTMLRQKTLLGETYVELQPGRSRQMLAEGGRLPDGQVTKTVELDEIFDALDPKTRDAFRTWQQELGRGIEGHGRDVNEALGNLPGFAADADDVMTVLDSQEGAVHRLVKNTGVTFGALNENEAQLRNLITSSKRVFDATASQNDALAETIRIFPTFLDESKLTLARLKTFSQDTDPLIKDLRPVARDLKPTLQDVHALAPDLESFFVNLDPLIRASRTGLPATSRILRGLEPMLGETGPFLSQLNPILQYLELNQSQVSDFITNGAAPLADTTTSPSGGVGHYLRQFGPLGVETAAIFRQRLSQSRGNSYLGPVALNDSRTNQFQIFPNFDCRPSGGERMPSGQDPGCFVQPRQQFQGRLQPTFPQIQANDYGPH
jgi:phospholipid/cholesterol/gamma-HCH transport system substrate-binding protein